MNRNNADTNNCIWLTVKEAAKLLNRDVRTIQNLCQKKKYVTKKVYGCGRGGKQIEILLSSLPEDAQAHYHHLEPVKPELEEMEGFTNNQKSEANNKAWIIELYHKRDKGMTTNEFVAWYNKEHKTDITKANVYQWQKKLKKGGTAALIDTRGGHNKGETSIPLDAWEYFYSLYMTQQKRSVQLCYDYMKKEFPNTPSVYAFYRKVKEISPYAITYYREGENALRDILPYMERSRLDINSNDIWFSDHHRMDVFTKTESGDKICRLWLTTFFDARSGKIISYLCRNASPNATAIKRCFKSGIDKYGIPKEVYFDNGADYRAKCFSQDYPLSLLRQIGVNTIYATPYHGQAKPVERFFKTLEERFGKMFPSYTGRDAKQRPEQMRVSNEKIFTYAASIPEFNRCLDIFIEEYNSKPSRGADMEGKSPDEVYEQNLKRKKELNDRQALTILCGTFEERTVQKNGIAFKNRYYECGELLHYFRKKVIINYDPDNIDELNVFDLEMRFIGVAKARIRTPFRHTTEEDYIKAQKEKKRVRKLVQEAKPIQNIDMMQLIAKNQLSEMSQKEEQKPAAIEQIVPSINLSKLESNTVSKSIDLKEPSLQSILMKKYEARRKLIGG